MTHTNHPRVASEQIVYEIGADEKLTKIFVITTNMSLNPPEDDQDYQSFLEDILIGMTKAGCKVLRFQNPPVMAPH